MLCGRGTGSDRGAGGNRTYRPLAPVIQDGIAGQSVFAYRTVCFSPVAKEARVGPAGWTTKPRRPLLSDLADDNAIALVLGSLLADIGKFSEEGFQAGTDLLRMIEDTRLALS